MTDDTNAVAPAAAVLDKLAGYVPYFWSNRVTQYRRRMLVEDSETPHCFKAIWRTGADDGTPRYMHIVLAEIDNSDIDYKTTYAVELAVYSDPSCSAHTMLTPGFASSGLWCNTPQEALALAALETLHQIKKDRAYRAREDSWRNRIIH
jgi:hypothetical protein